ncbi:hypothetical protein [Paracidovorax sp. MALMAid1276]|uniref:hypothetical protein n=1 Tax=Paracidovorax sp. MALMAid1276 TaxID=3411631 RepID=UPI003B99F072
MRRALSMLMVVMLVLRGLVGTAMAAGMVPALLPGAGLHGQPATSNSHAAHGPGPQAQASDAYAPGAHAPSFHAAPAAASPQPADIHQHHAVAAQGDHATCSGAPATGCASPEQHAGTCSACEICHAAMLDTPAAHTPALLPPGPLRAVIAAPFDSAPAALAIKPPIA